MGLCVTCFGAFNDTLNEIHVSQIFITLSTLYRCVTFLYALLHMVCYLVLFAGLSWTWIASDLIEKPYIYAGVGAFLILLALAVTSPKQMMKKLAKRWKPLHRFVYLAIALVWLHLLWQIKSDTSILVWFSAFAIPLLLIRIPQTQIAKKYFPKK